jgi:hypothetical protein
LNPPLNLFSRTWDGDEEDGISKENPKLRK